ncbi:MAG: AtpZ/AtpI family protein [Acidobacteria bacterium]|nr:AtpZ/AtpI family protein [Acidobacteriota bacterium]MBI3662473.1 AtpZ/AtpI family protein [Acidobacteriota bacterium]
MPPEPPRKGFTRFSQQFALAMELPFLLVGSTLTGGVFGYFVDSWLKTAPAFLIGLGGLGFYAGLRETLRRLKKMENAGNGNRQS